MHQADGADDPLVGEVEEEPLDLRLGEHSLVDDRARRQAREVDVLLGQFALGAFADAERRSFEVETGHLVALRSEEDLREVRHGRRGRRAHVVGVHGQLPPPEHTHALFGGDALDGGGCPATNDGVVGQEHDPRGVVAGIGQVEVGDLAEERVGELDQDARAVARVGLGATSAAMLQIAQRHQGFGDDVVVRAAGEIGDEGHATGVVLVLSVVQAR